MRKLLGFTGTLLALCLLAGAATAQNVLVYDDNSNDGVAAAACANRGYTCTVADSDNFTSLLTGGGWAIVVLDYPSNGPSGSWQSALATYVNGGGRAILTGWNAGDFTTLAPLFGVTLGASHDAVTFHRWSSHPLFASPNVVPATMVPAGDDWGDNGFYLTAAGGTTSAAGFTPTPTAGQAAIVIANGGRTIFNGFLFDDYFPGDADASGKDDIVELVENQMALVLSGAAPVEREVPGLGPTGLAILALVTAGLGALLLGRRLLA